MLVYSKENAALRKVWATTRVGLTPFVFKKRCCIGNLLGLEKICYFHIDEIYLIGRTIYYPETQNEGKL